MSMTGWLIQITGALGLLGYAVNTTRYWVRFGRVNPVNGGTCRRIDGLIGPEDLALTREGRLIISCDGRSEGASVNPNGAIIGLRPDAPEERVVLWNGGGNSFHPHGLDYFVDPGTGAEYLFAIDHRGTHDAVMIFRVVEATLTLVQEVIASDTTSLNDLAAVSKDQFYVTSDHNSKSPLAKTVSDYLRLPTGYVLYFDGVRLMPVASGISYANGIALDVDNQRLYVASMLRDELIEYERVPATGNLRKTGAIPLQGSPDNITVADDGGLVVAVHPKILHLARQRRERSFRAPSSILYISPASKSGARSCLTLYADPGENLAAASVAVKSGKRLFVGSVYDDHLMICDIPTLFDTSVARGPMLSLAK
jgi:arylesterase/paraoxonase